MNRRLTSSATAALALTTLITAPALAQRQAEPVDEPAPASPKAQAKIKAEPLITPRPDWMWPSLDATQPQGMADAQPGQFSELERRALAGAMVAGSLPLIIYGLGKLANTQRDHTQDRQVDAHAAGASIFAGMGMLAQGATMLAKDSPEVKRRREAMARSSATALTINPVLPLLERDAQQGRDRRNLGAGLLLAGGILGGAAIAALPVSDRTVDRRVLVGAGSAVALAGMGGAAYLYWTPPPEEDALKEAMQRQQQNEQRQQLKPRPESPDQ